MKTRIWDRAEVVDRLRNEIWRFITQASVQEEDVLLSAAALLQMSPGEVRFLAQLQFVLSEPVDRLLADMQPLIRRLVNTTVAEAERSTQRVHGAVRWGETYAQRAASGQSGVFVTAPARRAFNTPENEVLVFVLFAVAEFGKRTGWYRGKAEGPVAEINRRVSEATKWLQSREFADLIPRQPSPATVSRVRAGRNRKRYQSALDVLELYNKYIARLDRSAVREAVESRALITRSDDVLLELLCAFDLMSAIRDLGWKSSPVSLVGPGVVRPILFTGTREGETLQIFYQSVPPELSKGSLYREVQIDHQFPYTGPLRPDLVICMQKQDSVRWFIVEVKGGLRRDVLGSARHAALDLLAYRRAFSPVLDNQPGSYGLGYAWGAELSPVANSEVTLCTPDTLPEAVELLFGAGRTPVR